MLDPTRRRRPDVLCVLAIAVAALLATACRGGADPDAAGVDPTTAVRPVDTPAVAGSGQPRLIAGADGGLYLSWIDPVADGHALRFATWEGDGWSAPHTVAAGDDWFVNWADVPSLAAAADGTLAAHWLVKSGASTYAYDVWLAVSHDGGATWSDPRRAHDDGTETEHGFATIVPGPTGDDGFDVVWLDGRRMAAEPPGPMTLRHARLDRDGRVGPAAIVDERVCDCCPTDAVRTSDGLLLVYRDRSPEEVRDIWFSRHTADGWSSPQAVWDDGWVIGGCPVNGPAVDAAGSSVAAAWFTVVDDGGVVHVAFSADGGATFGAPTRIDSGNPLGRVDVVRLPDGTARVVWLERDGDEAAVLLRDVRPDGTLDAPRVVTRVGASRSSGYPSLTLHAGETFVAWTEVGETSRVRTGRLGPP